MPFNLFYAFLVLGFWTHCCFAQTKSPEFPEFSKIITPEFSKIAGGVYTLYKHQEKEIAYLEISANTLEQDFLIATTISGGSRFTGWLWNSKLVYWKRVDKQLGLFQRQLQYRNAKPTTPLGISVARTYKDTYFTQFPILTMNGGNPVISLNAFAFGQTSSFFGTQFRSRNRNFAKYVQLKTFPENVEIAIELPDSNGNFTVLHYSLRMLPASTYTPREGDDRVGYFYSVHKNLTGGNAEEEYFVRLIHRWNLQKQDPEAPQSPVVNPIIFYIEKTVPIRHRHAVREGILEWNKAFEKLGLLNAIEVRQQTDTNEFKDYDPANARYNFFRWITSDQAFARGPSRVDPRTGEILDADIVFDEAFSKFRLQEHELYVKKEIASILSPENISARRLFASDAFDGPSESSAPQSNLEFGEWLTLQDKCLSQECHLGEEFLHEIHLASTYFALLQEGEEAPAGKGSSKKEEWPEAFMFSAVKYLVMHEVGHTLGLRHNFKASSWKSLKNINHPNETGQPSSASVMDYNPLNVKGDEKDAVQNDFFMTVLGPYDYWAIEHGYTTDNKPESLKKIAEQCAKPEHAFATDEDVASPDPLTKRWDIGDNPLAYATHRLGLAEKMLKNLKTRALKQGAGYQSVSQYFGTILGEYVRAGQSALLYLGGEQIHRDHFGDPQGRDPMSVIEGEKQRQALKLVCDSLWSRKAFLLDPEVLTKLAPSYWTHWGTSGRIEHSYDVYYRISWVQNGFLARVFDPRVLKRIENGALKTVDPHFLTIPEIFQTVRESLWSELKEASTSPLSNQKPWISGARRNLQENHLTTLVEIALEEEPSAYSVSVRSLALWELQKLHEQIKEALKTDLRQDAYTKAHLESSVSLIQQVLKAGYRY